MYFAIRFIVASSILIAFYLTRGFDSAIETFVMAFAAFLTGQCVAFGVKMLTGEKERSRRSVLFVVGCLVVVAASVAFVVAAPQPR